MHGLNTNFPLGRKLGCLIVRVDWSIVSPPLFGGLEGNAFQEYTLSGYSTHSHYKNHSRNNINAINKDMDNYPYVQIATPNCKNQRQHAYGAGDKHPGGPDMVYSK